MTTLVVGYGNELRGDDALGRRLADEAEKLGFATLSGVQLLPEHAERISRFPRVVFADSSPVGERPELRLLSSPARGSWPLHAGSPAQLLSLCEALYGQRPQAWLLSLPGEEFGYAESLSRGGQASLRLGVELLKAWAARPG